MKCLIVLMVVSICSCATIPKAPSVGEAVALAILGQYELDAEPVFLSDAKSCLPEPVEGASTVSLSELHGADSQEQFPSGVFVLCRARVTELRASTTLQRLLVHESSREIKVSEQVVVELRRSSKGWTVTTFDRTAID